MPNMLNQPKHEESKPKLALQIRNQEQKRSRRRMEEEQKKKNSHQDAKIRTVRNCWLVRIVSLPFFDVFDFIFSFSTFALLV